jgi:methenyltetrahydrofolate cyclohydrolase
MTTSVWDLSLTSFREQVASAQPTPGGGAVCSVCGSLGLGLVLMALEITRRRSDASSAAELDVVIASARSVLPTVSAAADRDVRAFDSYMAAHRMPKRNEHEREARSQALRTASHAAAAAPLSAARAALSALAIAEQAVELTSAHVLSDVVAGAELLHAAILGLLTTMTMNLRPDDDSPELLGFRVEGDELAVAAQAAIEGVRARAAALNEQR